MTTIQYTAVDAGLRGLLLSRLNRVRWPTFIPALTMAGSPCPVEVMKQVQSRLHMPEVTICYGMTETVVTTQSGVDDPLDRRVTTVGGVHPHLQIKIVDPATRAEVPRGTAARRRARRYAGQLGG